MRFSVRTFLYIIIALALAQNLLNIFSFSEDTLKTKLIFSVGLGLVVLLSRPFLKIISFPVGGLVFHFLLLVIITLTMFALSTVLPGFSFNSVNLPELMVSGIIIGGFEVSGLGAGVLAGVTTSAIYSLLSFVSG